MDAITPLVKERPIIFSAAMVRAILEGRKTQTRRIIKDVNSEVVPSDKAILPGVYPNGTRGWFAEWPHKYGPTRFLTCPYGKPGDRLWVREAWGVNEALSPARRIIYAAEFEPRPQSYGKFSQTDSVAVNKWKPSIHMPRWASRILLEVVSVRVERLQDISEDDCWAEGLEAWGGQIEDRVHAMAKRMQTAGWSGTFEDAKPSFAALWESLNGGEAWDANPWVWVVEFKRVDA